ncbi:pilin [Gilvimarinus sp. DA14]|uniref:pilin n=1 Tax=Gilvimarinus sp. DA14 TaxID=2956798 RepID=UPI0020B7C395|nr:pilin [Gilvimarinus sp. DA14]UTF61643.1 pilin [Gilvimarinus sp. DA14]
MGIRLLVLAMLLCPLGKALAQVYTWTDEQGKVHYSDQRRVSHAEAKVIDIGGMPPAPLLDHQTPASYGAEVYPLVLDRFFYADSVSDENRALITYYFGGDCVSPTSENFNQLRVRYPQILQDDKKLQANTYRQLRKSSYGLLYRAGHYSMPVVDNAEIRVLNAQVTDLKINACRTKLMGGAASGDLESATAGSFDVLNSWIQVTWQLADSPSSDPSHTWVTQGVAATRLDRELSLYRAVEDAYLAALDQLQNDSRWRAAVTNPDANRTTAPAADPPDPQLQTPAQTYLQQAELARAFAEIAPLRVAVAEYYQVRGVMPLSVSAIGVRSPAMRSEVIQHLEMRQPGVMRADLAGANEGVFIELVPELEHGYTGIKWRCISNAAASILPSACEEY